MYPATREFQSPHHGVWAPGRSHNALFVHSTRSGQPNRGTVAGNQLELRSTKNWFLSPASRASSHLIVSPSEIVRMVRDDWYSWHAKEHSNRAYAIEMTQALTTDEYHDGHYDNMAICVLHYKTLGVETIYRPGWVNGDGGWTGHEDSPQGRRDGKSDPGDLFDWQRLLAMVNQEDEVRRLMSKNGYVYAENIVEKVVKVKTKVRWYLSPATLQSLQNMPEWDGIEIETITEFDDDSIDVRR